MEIQAYKMRISSKPICVVVKVNAVTKHTFHWFTPVLQIPSVLHEGGPMYIDCLYSTTSHKYAYIGTERRNAAQSSCQR